MESGFTGRNPRSGLVLAESRGVLLAALGRPARLADRLETRMAKASTDAQREALRRVFEMVRTRPDIEFQYSAARLRCRRGR